MRPDRADRRTIRTRPWKPPLTRNLSPAPQRPKASFPAFRSGTWGILPFARRKQALRIRDYTACTYTQKSAWLTSWRASNRAPHLYLKTNVPPAQTTIDIPEFRPRRFLRGGHFQTIGSFLLRRRLHLPKPESRLVEVAPGVSLLCQCHWQPDRRAALTVVILHGLEGSSDSNYMLGIAGKALAAGMNVVRMNQRNCGGTEHLAPTLYNSSLSGDVAAVASNLFVHDGVTRLALVGFSMGGNLVLKAAGEWGAHAPEQLVSVVAVCPAMDLAASADALHEPSNRLYEWYFMWKLRGRLRQKARLFPNDFDPRRLRGVRTLRQFDDKITAYYCGFSGAVDYYDRASASHVVDKIAVPTLILHAANDPFVRLTQPTRAKISSNPNVTFIEAPDGGHCAFVGARDGGDGYWAERQVVDFLRRV